MKAFFWVLFLASLVTTGQGCIPMRPPGEGNVPITTTTPGFTTSNTTVMSSTTTTAPEDTTTTTTAIGTTTTTSDSISTTTTSTTTTSSTASSSTTSLGVEITTSTSTTTTTTSGVCTLPTGDFSRVYADASATDFISGEDASCACPGGMEYAFATKLTDDTNVLVNGMQQDFTLTCTDICVCDNENMCYYIDMEPYEVRFFSYCDTGGCYLRAVNFGGPFFNANTGNTIDRMDQFVMGTMTYKPITDPIFLKITRISCNSCANVEDTCENSMGLIITRTKRQNSFLSKKSEI